MSHNWNYDYPKIARESGFTLKQNKDGPLDWRTISSIEVDQVIREQKFESVDSITAYLSQAPVASMLDTNILDPGIGKYFILSQLAIQYLLFCKKFLDETVTTLRESLCESQLENANLKKLNHENNNELLQLHKKFQQMETINEVVFPCSQCTKNFISNDMLNTHMKRKHGKTEEPETHDLQATGPGFCLHLRFTCFFVLISVPTSFEANPNTKRLYDDLLANYNRLIRPVVNNSETLTVWLGLKVTQLIEVNLKNQVMTTNLWVSQKWFDYKLRWDPDEYGGVEMLYVPSENIWTPDIVLFNNWDGNYEVTLMTKATLKYTGEVFWEPPAIYKSSCEMNVEYFPYDEQICFMKFGSWTYNGAQVDLKHLDQGISFSRTL
uniref:C2H2-type domain-containing protein n=1 Tax=Megaselia scalaris TaxID=36166 RepID=T1GUX9_MEGSC